jgi:hypothetical protein
MPISDANKSSRLHQKSVKNILSGNPNLGGAVSFQQCPVDLPVVEHMVGDATHPAWTRDFSFRVRFQFAIDSDACTIVITVRIHLTGAAVGAAQQTAWSDAIAAKWNRLCANGYQISFSVTFVATAADAHYVVNVHGAADPVGADMSNWNVDGTNPAENRNDVTHEFGHMIGNTDEYFTVNGHDYGPGRQVPNNVMNNPSEIAEPKHVSMIRRIAEGFLGKGSKCIARRVTEPCQ